MPVSSARLLSAILAAALILPGPALRQNRSGQAWGDALRPAQRADNSAGLEELGKAVQGPRFRARQEATRGLEEAPTGREALTLAEPPAAAAIRELAGHLDGLVGPEQGGDAAGMEEGSDPVRQAHSALQRAVSSDPFRIPPRMSRASWWTTYSSRVQGALDAIAETPYADPLQSQMRDVAGRLASFQDQRKQGREARLEVSKRRSSRKRGANRLSATGFQEGLFAGDIFQATRQQDRQAVVELQRSVAELLAAWRRVSQAGLEENVSIPQIVSEADMEEFQMALPVPGVDQPVRVAVWPLSTSSAQAAGRDPRFRVGAPAPQERGGRRTGAKEAEPRLIFTPRSAGLALLLPEEGALVRVITAGLEQRVRLFELRPDLAGAFLQADELGGVGPAVELARRQLGGEAEVVDLDLEREPARLRRQIEEWLSGLGWAAAGPPAELRAGLEERLEQVLEAGTQA